MTAAHDGPLWQRYRYDANGRRVKRLVGQAGEVWQVYSPDGELLAEYPKQGAATVPTKEYGYRGGQLLVVFDSTEAAADDKLRWLVTDHLGSTRMIVNKSGSLSGIKRRDYLPFGEELAATVGHRAASGSGYAVDDKPRQKFGSKERDTETGLDYFLARYFSSVQGRFTSPDKPFADQDEEKPQSWNLYAYVINNPLKYDDPTGLWKRVKTEDGTIIYEAEKGDTIEGLAKILNVPVKSLVGSLGGDKVQIGQQFDVTNFRDYQRPKTAAEIERDVNREITREQLGRLQAELEIQRLKLEIRLLQIELDKMRPQQLGVGSPGRWLQLGIAAKQLAHDVLKKWKVAGAGAGARSGQHGTPYARAATELREILKREGKGWLPEFREEIQRKIAEYEAKAGSINHK